MNKTWVAEKKVNIEGQLSFIEFGFADSNNTTVGFELMAFQAGVSYARVFVRGKINKNGCADLAFFPDGQEKTIHYCNNGLQGFIGALAVANHVALEMLGVDDVIQDPNIPTL